MQHDPFRSGHDLDLRSTFKKCAAANGAAKTKVVTLLSQKLLPKNSRFCTFTFPVISQKLIDLR